VPGALPAGLDRHHPLTHGQQRRELERHQGEDRQPEGPASTAPTEEPQRPQTQHGPDEGVDLREGQQPCTEPGSDRIAQLQASTGGEAHQGRHPQAKAQKRGPRVHDEIAQHAGPDDSPIMQAVRRRMHAGQSLAGIPQQVGPVEGKAQSPTQQEEPDGQMGGSRRQTVTKGQQADQPGKARGQNHVQHVENRDQVLQAEGFRASHGGETRRCTVEADRRGSHHVRDDVVAEGQTRHQGVVDRDAGGLRQNARQGHMEREVRHGIALEEKAVGRGEVADSDQQHHRQCRDGHPPGHLGACRRTTLQDARPSGPAQHSQAQQTDQAQQAEAIGRSEDGPQGAGGQTPGGDSQRWTDQSAFPDSRALLSPGLPHAGQQDTRRNGRQNCQITQFVKASHQA
jgi:hypothetical protein